MLNLKTLSFAVAASTIALAGLGYGPAGATTFSSSDIVIAQAGGTVTPPSSGATGGAGARGGAGAGAGAGTSGSMGADMCAKMTDQAERKRCMDRLQRSPGASGGASGSMGSGGGASGGTGTGGTTGSGPSK